MPPRLMTIINPRCRAPMERIEVLVAGYQELLAADVQTAVAATKAGMLHSVSKKRVAETPPTMATTERSRIGRCANRALRIDVGCETCECFCLGY